MYYYSYYMALASSSDHYTKLQTKSNVKTKAIKYGVQATVAFFLLIKTMTTLETQAVSY